ERDLELEKLLLERFNLSSARVARVKSNRNSLDAVGKVTAQYLSDNLSRTKTIGLSWGKTLQHIVSNMPKIRLMTKPIVFPLVGGLSMMDAVDSGDSLVQLFSEKIGAVSKHLYAPALVGSEQSYQVLMKEPSIISTLNQAGKVDVGIVGIGAYGIHSSSRLVSEMQLTENEYQELVQQKPVGDLCGRFYDAQGKALGNPSASRVISVNFDRLAEIPVLIGAASGLEKARGVLGALRSGVLNVLAVDSILAREVLKLADQDAGLRSSHA
ncbi:MAG: sugar-binding domain-containing protein, partial [Microbacteriaceae bacterium]